MQVCNFVFLVFFKIPAKPNTGNFKEILNILGSNRPKQKKMQTEKKADVKPLKTVVRQLTDCPKEPTKELSQLNSQG